MFEIHSSARTLALEPEFSSHDVINSAFRLESLPRQRLTSLCLRLNSRT